MILNIMNSIPSTQTANSCATVEMVCEADVLFYLATEDKLYSEINSTK